MDTKQFAEKPIKAVGTDKVELKAINHLDFDYKLTLRSDNTASQTGWLVIAELKPIAIKYLPEFCLRWDDKNRELDVDIYVDGKHRNDLWNHQGYKGHKTKVGSSEKQEYAVCIQIPNKIVFDGIIMVALRVGLYHEDHIDIGEGVQVEILS